MSTRIVGYLCLFAFICMCTDVDVAQTPADHAKFAIEFPAFNGPSPYYLTILESASPNSSPCSTFSYGHTLSRLANMGVGVEEPSALRLEVCVKGDMVVITPTAFYGDFDHQNPAPYEKLRPQILTTHSGRLNDTVVFREMEQVGLEPLTLRIVTARPEIPYHPMTRSDVPSVQIDCAPFDRTFGIVTLRNLSKKAVNAFAIGNSGETGSGNGLETEKGGLCVLIAPESSYQSRFGIPNSWKTVEGKFVQDPKPEFVILQSVLFSDGSYEGDAVFAAEMAAREFGAKVQRLRIDYLAEPILAEAGIDDEAKIERIRSGIRQLPAQADSEVLAQFHAQYPAFPKDVLAKVESRIGAAMKAESSSTDHLIEENEPILRQHRPTLPLARWWTTAVTECH